MAFHCPNLTGLECFNYVPTASLAGASFPRLTKLDWGSLYVEFDMSVLLAAPKLLELDVQRCQRIEKLHSPHLLQASCLQTLVARGNLQLLEALTESRPASLSNLTLVVDFKDVTSATVSQWQRAQRVLSDAGVDFAAHFVDAVREEQPWPVEHLRAINLHASRHVAGKICFRLAHAATAASHSAGTDASQS